MTNDAQIFEFESFSVVRARVKEAIAVGRATIRTARSELNRLDALGARCVAGRERRLAACEADSEANCSLERESLMRAQRARVSLRRVIAESEAQFRRDERLLDRRETELDSEFLTVATYFQNTSTAVPTGTSASQAAGGAPGQHRMAAASGERSSDSPSVAMLPSANCTWMNLRDLEVDMGIFDVRSGHGGAGPEDFIWAATAFRDQVLPGIARGMTREDFAKQDADQGNDDFRRLTGAHELFWNPDGVVVSRTAAGGYEFVNGMHRVAAAKAAGLRRLPVRVAGDATH